MSESKKRYGDYSKGVFIKDMYDVDLPVFLKRDIDALLEGIKTNSSLLDCLQDEVYGSINSAYWDDQISEKHADHLRRKYLLMRD